MRVLKLGVSGDDVRQWQSFLFGLGYTSVRINGIFDQNTDLATRDLQDHSPLKPDGIVGQQTIAFAVSKGFPLIAPEAYPKRPNFSYPNSARVRELFGSFKYKILAKGNIQITDGWANASIVKVHIPQLIGIEGAPATGIIYFHKKGARQLQSLFAAWERAGLLKYLKSWGGSFVPRMVRGSNSQLSNHAFGSAFDINAAWNGLGKTPAAADKPGTVLPLVKLANEHGFFWGGHYNSRLDGMHFELAVLDKFPASPFARISDAEIDSFTNIPTIPAVAVSPSVALPAMPSDSNFAPISDREIAENQPVGVASEVLPSTETAALSPPDNQPLGDPPEAPPRSILNVEDWKPFVTRWLKRAWGTFTGGNAAQASGLTFAALRDSDHWYLYAGASAVIFLVTLFFVLLASVGLGWILWHNRKEISGYIRMAKESVLNPNSYNLGLQFEKK